MTTLAKKQILSLAALAGLLVLKTQAQPYYVAGDYNSWANPSATAMSGGPTEYTFAITGGTAGAYENLKVTDGTWSNYWPGNNMEVKYDASGNNTINFFPGVVNDGWSPGVNRVGYADPGNMAWEVTGDFTSPNWGSDAAAQMTSAGGGVYTVTYVVATAGTHGFKFRTPNTWSEVNFGADFGNGGANGTFTTPTNNAPVQFQLDLPNGRWIAGAPAPAVVTNQIVFAVDMSVYTANGQFTPGMLIDVRGDFNNWTGGADPLTNNPTAANTNIYYSPIVTIIDHAGVTDGYKFNFNDSTWESPLSTGGGNRSYVLSAAAAVGITNLPAVYFNDQLGNDVLQADTPVSFVINMNGAVGTDAHVFDPTSDNVFVNGQFSNWYPWYGGINPANAPAGYQLFETPVGSGIFSNTIVIPKGASPAFQYKYGIGINGNGGPADDEAGYGMNHYRVVRATGFNPYPLQQDTFATMYSEPYFTATTTADGRLAVGAKAGSTVPVTWLGRPGLKLQVKSDLTGGTWQDVTGTDGNSWTNGSFSTNGFVSQTNWPASSKAFFRLVKP